jgi:hypothetical protein
MSIREGGGDANAGYSKKRKALEKIKRGAQQYGENIKESFKDKKNRGEMIKAGSKAFGGIGDELKKNQYTSSYKPFKKTKRYV